MRRWWWVLLLMGLLYPSQKVQADGAGFTVTPQLPANQIGGNTGWFNLLVKPGQRQALTVEVDNQSDEMKKLRLSLTNAFTQDNGQIGYEPNQQRDSSAHTQLTMIGSKPLTLNLGAHKGQPVTFQVTPPKQGIAGQVLGAIYVRDLTPSKAASVSGFALTNQFAMVVAVQLQTSQKLVPAELHLLGVKPKSAKLQAVIQNSKPRLFGKLTLRAKVMPVGENKVLFTQKDTNYAMAPNSSFNYQLTPKQPLPPGKYQLVIVASAGHYKWHLTKPFTLRVGVAGQSGSLPATPATSSQWWPWALALIAVLLLGLALGRWHGRQQASRR